VTNDESVSTRRTARTGIALATALALGAICASQASAQTPPRLHWKALSGANAVPLKVDSMSGDTGPFDPSHVVTLAAGVGGTPAPLASGDEPSLGISSGDSVIPKGTRPCEEPGYWPYTVASSRYPFLVHYHARNEGAMADRVVALLETAWERQIGRQGYTEPPSDQGWCGPDGKFDVFIWRGINTCQVNIVSERFVMEWGGRASFMFVDPWGDYGGKYLAQTMAHEFNHATHAANDWYELPIAFEMSASYVEQFYDGPADSKYVQDFQARADWALLRNDNYETWYMYGAALYLNFVRDYYFKGDDRFLPDLWVAMRNKPDLFVNSPHFVDAMNALLAPHRETFLDSVVAFARWRYFAGSNDDGKHFRRFPETGTEVTFSRKATLPVAHVMLGTLTHEISPAPMLTGSAYLEVRRKNAAQTSFQLSLELPPSPSARWVVQAVPGLTEGSDGEIVDLHSGTARVSFTSKGSRTLVLTVVPISDFDPYHQTDARYPVSVRIAP